MLREKINPLFWGGNNFCDFEIFRGEVFIGEFAGEFCSGREPYINFYDKHDILQNDYVIDKITKSKYVVTKIFCDVLPGLDGFYRGVKNQKFYVYYSTEKKQIGNIIFNIENATNSIIGTQATATLTIYNYDTLQQEIEKCEHKDKPMLYELLNTLKEIEKDFKPIKKGKLAKFGDLMVKYSPIAIGVGQILVSILCGK